MSPATGRRHDSHAALRALLLAAAALAAARSASSLSGQDTRSAPGDAPEWIRTWSPLLWTADLPRTLPSAGGALPEPILWPAPRVGLFWTAGNPAGLPGDVGDEYGVFRAASGEEDGTYRRPLDPERVSDTRVSAEGWRPFGVGGAALGRVRVARSTLTAALGDVDVPYPGSPFVVLDTAASDLGRTEATLEGAAGWRSGAWSLGVGLGYRAEQSRTEEAPVPRVLSAADPGATVGVAWSARPGLRLGAHARWRAHAERVLLYSVAASSRVYRLQGYFEARPQDISSGYYQRRVERDGFAGSVEAAEEGGAYAWALFVERGAQEEHQYALGENDPPKDAWTTDAWTAGGAARLGAAGADDRVAVSVRYTTLTGQATRGDLPDTLTFVSDESVLDATADVSKALGDPLVLTARATVRLEDRDRFDRLARVGTDLQGWTTGLGAGLTLRSLDRWELSAAGAVATYRAGGGIPRSDLLGPVYRAYVSPELALSASDGTAVAASVSVLWRGLPTGALWGGARYGRLKAASGDVTLTEAPRGCRSTWSAEVGVVLGR